jgi:hypothetical protein
MISEAVGNRDEELVEYVNVTRERFENFKVDYFASSKDTLKKMSREKNDKIVIRMNYMYDLKEDNECIVYMKKIIELCRQRQIKLLFFIPPANYMYAQELYGDLFTKKYEANVSKLTEMVNSESVDLLDLSYVLTKYQFADIHTIDETTNYEGRKIVSDKLAEKINSMRSSK